MQKVHKLESENFELNKQVEKIISGIEDQRRKHVKEVGYSRYLVHYVRSVTPVLNVSLPVVA